MRREHARQMLAARGARRRRRCGLPIAGWTASTRQTVHALRAGAGRDRRKASAAYRRRLWRPAGETVLFASVRPARRPARRDSTALVPPRPAPDAPATCGDARHRQPRRGFQPAGQRRALPLARRHLHADDAQRPRAPIPTPASPWYSHRPSGATRSSRPCRCCGSIRPSRAACCGVLARLQADDVRRREPMPSPARSCTRCATAKWRRCARYRSASTTAASMPRRSSFCLPAPTSSAPAIAHFCASSGRRSAARSSGSTGPAIPTATASSSTTRRTEQGLANQGWKDSTMRFSTPTAPGQRADRARRGAGIRLRRQVAAARDCARRSGRMTRARALETEADLRQHFEAAFWCEDIGIYALALDGEKKPCRVRHSQCRPRARSPASPRPTAPRA